MNEIRERIAHYTDYYSKECGYTIGEHEIYEICPVCNGSGHAKLKRKQFYPDKCKACKGTGTTSKIEIQ